MAEEAPNANTPPTMIDTPTSGTAEKPRNRARIGPASDRHARRPTAEQLEGLIAEGHQILTELGVGVGKGKKRTPNLAALLHRSTQARRDGFPTSSIPEGSSGGNPDHIGDLVAENLEGREAADGSLRQDPIHRFADTTLRGLTDALGDLRLARDSLVKAFRPEELHPVEPGCSNHARHGRFEFAVHNGRCAWCYRFWLAEGRDAPGELLEAKDEGRRITQALVRRTLEAQAGPRNKKRSRLSRR